MQTTLQPVVVSKSQMIASSPRDDLAVDSKNHTKLSFVLGIIELGSGVIFIIVNSFVLGEKNEYIYSTYGAGPAIWSGFVFILAGILSLVSVQIQKKVIIDTSLAMHIISSIFGFYLFLWPDAGVIIDAILSSLVQINLVQVGMGSVLLLLSLVVCVVSIWIFIIKCMACCCAYPYTTPSTVIITVPMGTVIHPGAITHHSQANESYDYQHHVTNQVVNMQKHVIQSPGSPQQPVIQTPC